MEKRGSFYGGILRDVINAIRDKDWFSQQVGKNPPFHTFGFRRGTEVSGGIGPEIVRRPPAHDDYTGALAPFLKAARTASPHPPYLEEVRLGYARLGADLDKLDHLVRLTQADPIANVGALTDYCLSFANTESGNEDGMALMSGLFEALIISRYQREGQPNLTADSMEESAREQEVLFYQEAIEKAETAIARSEQLEPLRFADPLVEEATRCFLHQFYRATVLLCSTALETRLKTLFGKRDLFHESKFVDKSYYQLLVSEAVRLKHLPEERREPADRVFARRNPVAHSGEDPGIDVAQEVLVATRLVLEAITPPSA